MDTETGGLNPLPAIEWSLSQELERGSEVKGLVRKPAPPILEIGAIALSPITLTEISEFHSLCGPEANESFDYYISRCEKNALEVNGFDARLEELKSAPPQSTVLKNFAKWAGSLRGETNRHKYHICGQNVRYDISMINAACRRYGVDFEVRTTPIELMSYSLLYFALADTPIVANYKLVTVAKALGIPTEGAHSALVDVRMTAACLRKIFERFSKNI